MRKLVIGLATLTAAAGHALAAPAPSNTDKWGVYATLAENGWWLSGRGPIERYSWVRPGEQLKLEGYEADGTLIYTRKFRIEGSTFINEGFVRTTISSVGPRHISFGPNNIMELDEDLYQLQHRFTSNGKPAELRFDRVRPPDFPTVELRAQFKSKITCPPTKEALARMLAPMRANTTQKEDPVVNAGGGFFLGGYAGERSYPAASFTFLGAHPTKVVAPTSGGQPFSLEAMLPSHDPKRYEATFRAAFPRGRVYCDQYGCRWQSREDTWNAPEGTLTDASIAQVITSKTELRFLCTYR